MLRTSHSLLALSLIALTGCPEEPATVSLVDAGRPADAAVADAGRSTTPAKNGMDAGRPKEDETGLNPGRDAGRTSAKTFTLSSPSFRNGGELPAELRCPDGDPMAVGMSPELAWTAGPDGTARYAIVMNLVDSSEPSVAWAVVNIPGDETSLDGNLPPSPSNASGRRQLRNSRGTRDYAPPCGDERAEYDLTIYALGEEIPGSITRVEQLVAHLEENPGLVLGQAKLTVHTSP